MTKKEIFLPALIGVGVVFILNSILPAPTYRLIADWWEFRNAEHVIAGTSTTALAGEAAASLREGETLSLWIPAWENSVVHVTQPTGEIHFKNPGKKEVCALIEDTVHIRELNPGEELPRGYIPRVYISLMEKATYFAIPQREVCKRYVVMAG